MSKQTFTPNKIISYFKTEWVVLLIVTVSGLIYNLGLLAGPWFEGRMTGCLIDILNGRKTFFKIINVVFIWNKDGNKRLTLNLHMTAIPARMFRHLHFSLNTNSSVMFLNCTASGFIRIRLTLWICRNGIHMTSPVIQYSRNMDYLFCLFAATQDKIIILRTVILLSQTAYLIYQGFFDCKNVADIIVWRKYGEYAIQHG